jgi:cephalosporin hydroxylase
MAVNGEFLGGAYIDAIRTRYPALVNDGAIASVDLKLHIGIVQKWSRCANVLGADSPDRFQSLGQRSFSTVHNAWSAAYSNAESETSLRRLGASSSYKGLVLLKPPYDIVLYSNLIWELRPKTIIEFGALQGGSALWFADQLDACGQDGEVHSFELLDKCIHPSASHRRLHFHHADLRRLDTLDERLFARFPHPWLVVDDAHVNYAELMPFVVDNMHAGDYFIAEDALAYPTADIIAAWVRLCDRLNLRVDSKYTDAFGYNVTCAPNAWLKKVMN